MKIIRNQRISWIWFAIILSLVYAFTINLFEFIGIPESHLKGFIFLAVQWFIVSAVSTGIIGIISVNKIIFTIFFPVILILSVAEVFLRHTLGSTITGTTIEIALENNLEMWLSVINMQLVILLLLALAVSGIIIFIRWKYVVFRGKINYLFIGVLFVLGISPLFLSRIYGMVSSRMPYAIYNGMKDYVNNRKSIEENRTTYENEQVKTAEFPPNIILVIGESLRADHLSVNGYERETMPLLSKREKLISLSNMNSTGSHTFVSLPYLFTRADTLNQDLGYEEQSFITLFKNGGYKSAWIANQDISSSYTYFAHETDTLLHVNSQRSLYSYEPWLDKDVLPVFKKWRSENSQNPQLVIIHSIGSHWWYKSHYDEEDRVFLPDMDSKELSVLSSEQIINSYDNTIIATDRFIDSIIKDIENENAILIYLSDHGESLGEGGEWLHGTDAPQLHKVAAWIWYSDEYSKHFEDKIALLQKKTNKPLSSDNLFYSIIDFSGLETRVFDPTKSWIYEEEN